LLSFQADWGKDFTSGNKKVYGILRNRFEDRIHSYPGNASLSSSSPSICANSNSTGIGIWYAPLKEKEELTEEGIY